MKANWLLFCFFLLLPVTLLGQRAVTITGTVTDDVGNTLPGANVFIELTRYGAATDADGSFSFNVPAEEARGQEVQLSVTFIGYKTASATIRLSPGTVTQNFSMDTDVLALGEVVTIGYGIARKEEVTGSIKVIHSEKLEQVPVSSFQEVLQGNSGMQVVARDGAPGAGISIRVRGIGSINASNEPLYVIDGIPVTSGSISTTDFNNGGRSSNVLASINPNDIESVVVAKDAASTAIYGARGANGVVMINTKGGVSGRGFRASSPQVEVKLQRGYSDFAFNNLLEGINTEQYRQLYFEGYANAGSQTLEQTEESWARQFPQPANTIWLDEMSRTGVTNQFDISAQGGTNRFNYFVSGSLMDQDGTIEANFFKRHSSRVNLAAQPTDRLTIKNNLNLSYFKQRGITDGTRWQAPMYLAYLMSPAVPIFDETGQYYADHKSFFMGGNNPVGHLNEDERELEQTRIIDNLYARYEITDDLHASTSWSFDVLNVDEYQYRNPRYGDARNSGGDVNEGRTDVINWQGIQTLNYETIFDGVHSVDLLVGFENQKISTDVVEAWGEGFSHPDLKTLASAAVPEVAFSSRTSYAFQSYFSRANYNYAHKYYASASFRRDGSSRFGPDKRWGTFWSFGLGYTLTEESFMQNTGFLNYLKLRGSYGETGNAEIGNFPWAGLYGFGSDYDGQPGAAPSQIANPILTWESQQNLNIGFDFAVLDDRLSGSFDAFRRSSKELLLERPLSFTSGFREVEQNVGDMRNTGVELALRGDILRRENLDLSLNFNITTLSNEITRLPEPFVDTGTSRYFRREEGRDFQEFWLYGWAGVDPANGDPLWYTDSTKTATTNRIGDAVRFYDGKSASPDFYGSFGLSARVGRVTVIAQANYQFGNYVFDAPGWVIHGDGRFTPRSTSSFAFENRWTTPGQEALFPQHRWGGNQSSNNRDSDRYLFKGDFIRLRTLKIGYDVPRSLITQFGVNSLEVYLNLNNYLTWVADDHLHFDPEQTINGVYNTITPISKTASFGINIGL
ncbi:SusC/RagA family TonB-linked outer membrane protein [bacterium]|nr:SusC/RagA family TonB-linked outer membrane protein [bacterium]